MRTEGIAGAAIPDTRGVPLPRTVPYTGHVTGRPARDPLAASPFRGKPIVEFTPEQLAAAGYNVPGQPKAKTKRPTPHGTGPRGHVRKFDHEAAIQAYLAGESTTSIAERLDISAASVRGAIKAAGHELRHSTTGTRRASHNVDVHEAARLSADGMTHAQIGEKYGVSADVIGKLLRTHGVDSRHNTHGHRPRFDHDAAVAQYLAGETSDQVGQRHGVTSTAVLNAVKAAGHTPRRAVPTHRATGPRTTTPVDDIVRLYTEQELSPPQIAERLGITPKTVRLNLDAAGVPRRDDRAGHSGGTNRLPDSVLRAAGDLYATGLTRTEVAARLGIGVKAVDRGIRLVGDTPRPAAHIPGAQLHGTDGAAALKDLMAANEIRSRDVRAWARQTGRDCPDWGIPSRQLVEDYLLARPAEQMATGT